jgi:5-methylcytosine-specific restriction endonuclease McrA
VEEEKLPEKLPDRLPWPNNPIGRARVRKFKNSPTCYYCDRSHKKINKFTVDHVEPASKGGKNGDNLVLSCKNCNWDKQSHTPEQYMELCIKRAKRVMHVHRPGVWKRFCIFFRLIKIWLSVGEGSR